MQNTINADSLTLDTFRTDMGYALSYCDMVTGKTRVSGLPTMNPTPNFSGVNVYRRMWLSRAVKLCRKHGVALPRMRRVTKDERMQFATALHERICLAVSEAECNAIDIVSERAPHASKRDASAHYALTLATLLNVASAQKFLTKKKNTSLTLVGRPSYNVLKGAFPMFQRLAIAVSILALCLASVSCVAHAVVL